MDYRHNKRIPLPKWKVIDRTTDERDRFSRRTVRRKMLWRTIEIAAEIVSLLLVVLMVALLSFAACKNLPWFLKGFLGIYCVVLVCLLVLVVLNELETSSAK